MNFATQVDAIETEIAWAVHGFHTYRDMWKIEDRRWAESFLRKKMETFHRILSKLEHRLQTLIGESNV